MSKSDDAKDGKDGAKPKGKKKLLIIIVAVVFLAGGGVGGYLMFSGGSKSGKAAAEVKPSPVPGTVLALEAVTVNLAEGHYLKLKLALQLTDKAGAEMDGSKALDLAITAYTNKPMAELASEEGRNKVKEELLKQVEEAYPEEVMDIYVTTFVMQ
jgi:flagellar protein FliL